MKWPSLSFFEDINLFTSLFFCFGSFQLLSFFSPLINPICNFNSKSYGSKNEKQSYQHPPSYSNNSFSFTSSKRVLFIGNLGWTIPLEYPWRIFRVPRSLGETYGEVELACSGAFQADFDQVMMYIDRGISLSDFTPLKSFSWKSTPIQRLNEMSWILLVDSSEL